jgi:hypothetical protein
MPKYLFNAKLYLLPGMRPFVNIEGTEVFAAFDGGPIGLLRQDDHRKGRQGEIGSQPLTQGKAGHIGQIEIQYEKIRPLFGDPQQGLKPIGRRIHPQT